MEAEFYTVQEFADRLNVSYWTVLRAVKCGEIQALKINTTYRILKSEVGRLLAVEYAKHNTEI